MNDWTPETIVAVCMSEIANLMLGKCPASGLPLVYDNPHSEAPRYRLSCDMCDCFGYWTPKREA